MHGWQPTHPDSNNKPIPSTSNVEPVSKAARLTIPVSISGKCKTRLHAIDSQPLILGDSPEDTNPGPPSELVLDMDEGDVDTDEANLFGPESNHTQFQASTSSTKAVVLLFR